MVKLLVERTNEKAHEYEDILKTAKENDEDKDKYKYKWKDVDEVEMYAYIAVLIYVGSCRAGCSISDLFNEEIGLLFVRVCFSRKRFMDINKYLRCDIKANRKTSKNKYLIVHDFMLLFQSNCKTHAIPSEIIAVDEKMCSFRGATPLRMYIPHKLDKFGMLLHV